MDLFFYNKDSLVFPGVSTHVFDPIEMDLDHLVIDYGLMLPTTAFSFTLLRYLRQHPNKDVKASDYAPPAGLTIALPHLNNHGVVELAVRNDANRLFVVEMPQAKTLQWKVCLLSDYVKSRAIADAIKGMSYKRAAQWIDENTSLRFQQPICVDLKKWREERKNKPVLPSHMTHEEATQK